MKCSEKIEDALVVSDRIPGDGLCTRDPEDPFQQWQLIARKEIVNWITLVKALERQVSLYKKTVKGIKFY